MANYVLAFFASSVTMVLRIIHGRGIGVQREMVRSVLARAEFVADFEDAPAEAGGWGAGGARRHAHHRDGYIRFSYANSLANLMEAVERIKKVSVRWEAAAAAQRETSPKPYSARWL